MFRRIVLFFMLFGSCFVVRAGVSPSGGPQSPATPAAVDSLSLPADTLVRRRSFVGRIIDYFGKSAVDRTFEKKIDLTFAGGPNYSKTNNFGIGVLAAGLYRIDRTDSLIPPSDVSVFATVSISGFYSVGVEGNTYFRRSRSKMDYQAMFVSAPRDLWGIGYCDARRNPETSYVEKQYKVHARYVYRVLPHTYVGSRLSFQHTDGTKFDAAGDSYIRHQKHSYDLYTGTGTIANFIARQARKVIGIEYVEDAIRDAKLNAEVNGLANTDFYAGDMKDVLTSEFIALHGRPDVMIVDPPRAGMHTDVVNVILESAPERIVYVSCNPATQARDLAMLDAKYKVTAVRPVDMFPHTHHVENVVRLDRRPTSDTAQA